MKYLITGGAGFIASHIADRLIDEGHQVCVYDNFSTGFKLFIERHLKNRRFKLIRADLWDCRKLTAAMNGSSSVFHFAANADVRGGPKNTWIDLRENTLATRNVLEAMRKNGVKEIIFASSATVYGEPEIFPTPETCPPMQTSLYGASKLAAEALIEAYGEYYGIKSWSFRFVSFLGERYTHGVVFDFIKKLRKNPKELEILGDGGQKKSYLDVTDGVEAIFAAWRKSDGSKKPIFNLGHDDYLKVTKVADIVTQTLGFKNTRYRFTGGIHGWPGDSPFVHLDTAKIKSLGWKPRVPIEDAVKKTARYLLKHPELFRRA